MAKFENWRRGKVPRNTGKAAGPSQIDSRYARDEVEALQAIKAQRRQIARTKQTRRPEPGMPVFKCLKEPIDE